jgi:UDP-galactopyranose mutase
MNRWTRFNHFVYRPKVRHGNSIYSFPINMFTLHQLWGAITPDQARRKLEQVKIPIENPSNLEEWVLSQVGEEIYHKFIYGYTKKQWNRDPKDLPSFIIKRLPIRLTYDDNYFDDKYQGIPIGGYTAIFERLLEDIPLETGVDYLKDRDHLNTKAKRIVYTGPIDEFFSCEKGRLEWRSLRFEHQLLQGDAQGNAVINYTEEHVPFTRMCEHKHFEFGKQDHTVITKEFPQDWTPEREKFYPVNDEKNNDLYRSYRDMVDTERYIMGGRLADYKYYDMHQVVGSALVRAEKESGISS